MPVEPSQSKLKRRASRKELEDALRFDGGHAREIELKRNRGEISCAECRRLKIKCDKTIPCQSCIRRGCATICPNGSLATGQGTRFVLAATEHLHRRIARMNDRIRLLEDALGSLQAKHSEDPHPLLRDELLSVNAHDDDEDVFEEDPSTSNVHQAIDAFGTLSISEHGITQFFGPTGGSESLLLGKGTSSSHPSPSASSSARESKSPPLSLPSEFSYFSRSFPFTPVGPTADVYTVIRAHLPPHDRAVTLVENFLENAAWFFPGIGRLQLCGEMLPAFYHRSPPDGDDVEYSGPHDLALLFIVFALGALFDMSKDPAVAEAEHFHQLTRAAIGLQPVLEGPSISTIQSLHLLSMYYSISGEIGGPDGDESLEITWSLVTLAAHLSQTIGLHRDSARWGLSARMVQRRRAIFWNLFLADAWHSLNTGRPPAFSLAYVDCCYPTLEGDDSGSPQRPMDNNSGYGPWAFRFAAECVTEVAARTLTAEAPTYATIMEVDKKVREFHIPEEAARRASASGAGSEGKPTGMSVIREDPMTLADDMQYWVMSHSREVLLLYVHRSFFAQAIIEHPANPLRSTYAPSFLAAYRASTTILRCVSEVFALEPAIAARFWPMWTFAFSAGIVFGTVVTRGPKSPLASSAMTELERACVLFSKASIHSRRAAKALPILTRLSEKAHLALSTAANEGATSAPGLDGQLWSIKHEDDDQEDELAIFAGRTRLISVVSTPFPPRSFTPSPSLPADAPAPTTYHGKQQESYARSFVAEPHSASSSSVEIAGPWTEPQQHHQHHLQTDYIHPHAQHHSIPSSQYASSSSSSYHHHSEHASVANPAAYGWSEMNQSHYYTPPSDPYPLQHQPHSYHQSHTRHQHHEPVYGSTPAFRDMQLSQALPPPELADLGLVSRDSRLDQRWASFMQDSGVLDDANQHPSVAQHPDTDYRYRSG
ncbi:hypothetical protein PLICRDRAFT_47428 [Plicaturopsis crispa FD-325 SS-3]|uniref:Unplaced genomic scaffold PLICRscaffold_32, whole genome shotgun sequence n=1 Tax=Plicaturopsis crispa FD-325 SS-3 TaxID=944288 RepID=A0A0C9T1L6_PLICR|nr:hypothetical protein PLICRDRAFT_47428 [Plicaturopsis crispa FD-325 SS-3]